MHTEDRSVMHRSPMYIEPASARGATMGYAGLRAVSGQRLNASSSSRKYVWSPGVPGLILNYEAPGIVEED